MLTAIFLFVLGSAGLLVFEEYLHNHPSLSNLGNWLSEHLYIPTLRAVLVLIFVAAAYPALFGLHDAPVIGTLLSDGHYRLDWWINGVLLVSLALPTVPGLGQIPGIVLTLQGMVASAMLFGWLAQDMGLAQYWLLPGWGLLGKILLITGAAGLLSWMAGSYLQLARKRLVAESLRLLAQMPALIIFGSALGRQLDGL
ncbi:MAG: hypothetical protein O7C69_02965 [Gammaproteobacteria bacterium]|nr:hypothetical protein [Gammaproteobacteria bacterium]TDJ11457.1 MAG: hypothetical protein E2O64_03465 [Gammaproteobacteria bacterium]